MCLRQAAAFAPVCRRCFGLHAPFGCFFFPGNQQSKTSKSDIRGEDCTRSTSVSNPHRLRASLSQKRDTKLHREQNIGNIGYLIVWFRRILGKCDCSSVLIKNYASFNSVVVGPLDDVGPYKFSSILICMSPSEGGLDCACNY